MLIRARREQDVPRCVTLLRAVHEHDGYPAVWPSDPGRWLTSAGTDIAAWVAVDGDRTIRGHAAVQAGRDDPLSGHWPGRSTWREGVHHKLMVLPGN